MPGKIINFFERISKSHSIIQIGFLFIAIITCLIYYPDPFLILIFVFLLFTVFALDTTVIGFLMQKFFS